MFKISLQKKKKEFFEDKVKKYVGNSKTLWKALKLIGLRNKSDGCIISALAENQIVKHDIISWLKAF